MEEQFIKPENIDYVAPAVAGESSVAQAEDVARKASANTQEITILENEVEKGAQTNNGFGVVADVAMDALGLGGAGKVVSAGLMAAEDRATGHSETRSTNAFEQLEKETTRAPGLYRNHDSARSSAGVFESAMIASSTLQKQDSAGLLDTSPKNLATMKSDDAAKGISANVTRTKEMVANLKNTHELAAKSVAPAMDAALGVRARALGMAPGMAPSLTPSMRPNEMLSAAKKVSEWDDPDRWRSQS